MGDDRSPGEPGMPQTMDRLAGLALAAIVAALTFVLAFSALA